MGLFGFVKDKIDESDVAKREAMDWDLKTICNAIENTTTSKRVGYSAALRVKITKMGKENKYDELEKFFDYIYNRQKQYQKSLTTIMPAVEKIGLAYKDSNNQIKKSY